MQVHSQSAALQNFQAVNGEEKEVSQFCQQIARKAVAS
jgi:hypothetical protein